MDLTTSTTQTMDVTFCLEANVVTSQALIGRQRSSIVKQTAWKPFAMSSEQRRDRARVKIFRWMHTENIYAVAQKHYTYVYDNTGTELHCVKAMNEIKQLEFLPHHFLLVGGVSFLSYFNSP